jgi:hypothetical protein
MVRRRGHNSHQRRLPRARLFTGAFRLAAFKTPPVVRSTKPRPARRGRACSQSIRHYSGAALGSGFALWVALGDDVPLDVEKREAGVAD